SGHPVVWTPTHWKWVSFSGKDAADFLHRLTTVNIKRLATGTGSPGCFLNAKGQIVSFFHLWRMDSDKFFFELDAGADGSWLKRLLDTIEMYTFSEKISVEVTSLAVQFKFSDEPMSDVESHRIVKSGDGFFCHHGSRFYGRSWVSAWGGPLEKETISA